MQCPARVHDLPPQTFVVGSVLVVRDLDIVLFSWLHRVSRDLDINELYIPLIWVAVRIVVAQVYRPGASCPYTWIRKNVSHAVGGRIL